MTVQMNERQLSAAVALTHMACMQLADYRAPQPLVLDLLAPADPHNRHSVRQQLEVQKVMSWTTHACCS